MAPPRAVTLLVALLAALPERGRGHGQLVTPRPRNSIDFDDPRIPAKLRTTWAWCQNITGAPCNNGQTAYWYSQGCYIGCAQCDHVSGRRQVDLCGKGLVGMLPDESVSVNREHATGASRNGKLDIYRHNPWRAPGHAPVADACGLAGGTPWKDLAPEEGRYITTAHAHHGMNGTDLPEMPTGTVWKAGGTADVAWQVRYNHGGGYAYRLCPASENLTEACFQKHPMDFVRDRHALLLGDGTKIPIAGVFTNTGTSPRGSTWARLPIPAGWASWMPPDTRGLGPRCSCDESGDGTPGDYNCGCRRGEETDGCLTPGNCSAGACEPCPGTPGSDCSRCDNRVNVTSFPPPADDATMAKLPAVHDVLKVPMLPPGKYTLGFRYDCDQTAQVWSNCADVEIIA
jgi:hypothetical protein